MKTVTLLLAFFMLINMNAQWTTDTTVNTLVANSEGGDMKAIGAASGKTYVVFWKVVAPPTNYELRLQILDVDGTQLLGNDGILVSDAVPMSTYTVIWNITVDTLDNLYIGVTGTGGGDPAYAFKLDSNGNHLWGANGINVGSGNVVTIKPLSNGEVIVAWYPDGQALMQKYDLNGVAVWGAPQTVVSGASSTVPANIFELSGNDFIVVFHVILAGINSHLYAQRYDEDGFFQWANPTQLSNQATAFNRTYSVAQNGDALFFGYFGSSGVRFDSFLQRINADGTLPWGINGSDFDTNQTNYEMETRIAHHLGSQHIWSICTYTDNTQGPKGEYVQKFDIVTGSRQLSDNAKQVYPIGSENVHAGDLQLQNDSPLFLIKKGFDAGATPTTLDVVYLDAAGDFAWQEESRPMATYSASKSRIHFTTPANAQSVAVFIENKGIGPRIYAQNFEEDVLGAAEFDVESLSYNNPISDVLSIESTIGLLSIEVVNMMGQIVYKARLNDLNSLRVDAATWNSGFYLIRVKTSHGIQNQFKVIKR